MQEYEVDLPSGPTTLQLSDDDAKERGLKLTVKPPAPKAKDPANKQATPANKAGVSDKQAQAASEAFGKG